MVSKSKKPFERPAAAALCARIIEPRNFIQVLSGPRQVGKSTLAGQVADRLPYPVRFVSADEPTLRGSDWISTQWHAARLSTGQAGLLILDEVQKIPGWSETVKRLWDEDTRSGCPLRVMLLGSAPLLISQGLTESLAGRFELTPLFHWSYSEMREAFGWTLDRYLYFGGYPGAAPLIADPPRWARYILDSLVETSLSRDVLLMTRVDKPALLRRLYELACRYSGQVLSFNKMLGQLQDAGNTTTLAHYLDLLAGAGMVRGLAKYAGDAARSRASSPKLQVLNTALMTAASGLSPEEAHGAPEFRGRLVESAVGAHLAGAEVRGECRLYYWREGNHEVDFIVQNGKGLTAIEVKSGRAPRVHSGLSAFNRAFAPRRLLIVGEGGISMEEFLTLPVANWLQ